MTTTIQVKDEVRDALGRMKIHPRETYNDILERLMEDMQELCEETKREIKIALKEIKSGKFKIHEEVGKEMGF